LGAIVTPEFSGVVSAPTAAFPASSAMIASFLLLQRSIE